MSLWRKTSLPMWMPRSMRRSTANHIVVASSDPCRRSHGLAGSWSSPSTSPASMSWFWVAT